MTSKCVTKLQGSTSNDHMPLCVVVGVQHLEIWCVSAFILRLLTCYFWQIHGLEKSEETPNQEWMVPSPLQVIDSTQKPSAENALCPSLDRWQHADSKKQKWFHPKKTVKCHKWTIHINEFIISDYITHVPQTVITLHVINPRYIGEVCLYYKQLASDFMQGSQVLKTGKREISISTRYSWKVVDGGGC